MTAPMITTLTDQQALQALRLVVDRRHTLPDPAQLETVQARITEAAGEPVQLDDTTAAPQTSGTADTTTTAPGVSDTEYGDTATGDGTLAREVLTYLAAADTDTADLITRAIAISTAPPDPLAPPERVDPVTIGVGVLVVLALQTEVRLERGSSGKWRFLVHKKAMSDSALSKLLAKVLSHYSGGGS